MLEGMSFAQKPRFTYNIAFIKEKEGKKQVLLVQGKSGKWYFPGGKQDSGETVFDTIKREIQEELSVNFDKKQLQSNAKNPVGGLYRTIENGKQKDYAIQTFIIDNKQITDKLEHIKIPEKDSIQDAIWVNIDELTEPEWQRKLTAHAIKVIKSLIG